MSNPISHTTAVKLPINNTWETTKNSALDRALLLLPKNMDEKQKNAITEVAKYIQKNMNYAQLGKEELEYAAEELIKDVKLQPDDAAKLLKELIIISTHKNHNSDGTKINWFWSTNTTGSMKKFINVTLNRTVKSDYTDVSQNLVNLANQGTIHAAVADAYEKTSAGKCMNNKHEEFNQRLQSAYYYSQAAIQAGVNENVKKELLLLCDAQIEKATAVFSSALSNISSRDVKLTIPKFVEYFDGKINDTTKELLLKMLNTLEANHLTFKVTFNNSKIFESISNYKSFENEELVIMWRKIFITQTSSNVQPSSSGKNVSTKTQTPVTSYQVNSSQQKPQHNHIQSLSVEIENFINMYKKQNIPLNQITAVLEKAAKLVIKYFNLTQQKAKKSKDNELTTQEKELVTKLKQLEENMKIFAETAKELVGIDTELINHNNNSKELSVNEIYSLKAKFEKLKIENGKNTFKVDVADIEKKFNLASPDQIKGILGKHIQGNRYDYEIRV